MLNPEQERAVQKEAEDLARVYGSLDVEYYKGVIMRALEAFGTPPQHIPHLPPPTPPLKRGKRKRNGH